MSPLTHDRSCDYSKDEVLGIPVAAGERIFAGSFVCTNAEGFAVPGDDQPNFHFEGVSNAAADNRTGDDGDIEVLVWRRGRFRFSCFTFITQAAMGAPVYVLDDETFEADVADVANGIEAGIIARVVNPHEALLEIAFGIEASARAFCQPTTTMAPTTTTQAPVTTTPAPVTTTQE